MRGTKKMLKRRILPHGRSRRGGRKLRSGERTKRQERRGRRKRMSWSSLCLTTRCSLSLDRPLMKMMTAKARRKKTRRTSEKKRAILSKKQFKLKGKSYRYIHTRMSFFKLWSSTRPW